MKVTNDKMETLIRKVKALYALSENNPSKEEAALAAMKAQELVAKYNLTITDVEDKVEMTTSQFHTGIDKSWKYGLAHIICDNFRCHHWWVGKHTVIFMGYHQDTEVARMTFEYLFKVCEKGARAQCRKAYKTYGTETGVYPSYTRGFLAGVKEKLDAQCVALAVVTPKEVTDAFTERTKTMKSFDSSKARTGTENFIRSEYQQGKQDGRAAMNSRALEGGK